MLNKLKELNKDIMIYSVHDDEFKKYGKVLDFNADEFVKACKEMKMPESGSYYQASVEGLEKLSGANKLREMLFGGCGAQITYLTVGQVSVAISMLAAILKKHIIGK